MSARAGAVEGNSFTSRYKMVASKTRSSRPRFGWFGLSGLTCSEPASGHEHHKEIVPAQPASSPHQRTCPGLGSSTDRVSCSPSASRHSVKSGHSLFMMAGDKRARKVRFYRNGDRFFKGMVLAVSTHRFRTFESLLTALTSSPLCNSKVMPSGVRCIFSLQGTRVESLDELLQGRSFVCSSTDVFRRLDYRSNQDPVWNARVLSHNQSNHACTKSHRRDRTREEHRLQDCETYSTASSHSQSRPHSARGQQPRAGRSKSTKSEMCASERQVYEEYQRTFVSPRLITVVRNGRRPRRAFRLLLNKRTAQTFDQVIADITEVIKLDCGRISKVFTMSGQQVMCLADFFQKETLFLACGTEKLAPHDLTLDGQELRLIKSYQPNIGKTKGRQGLRRLEHSPCKSSGRESRRSEHLHRLCLSQESNIKTVNKDNIDAYISKLQMPLSLTNKYDVSALVGTGNFAVVMECKEKRTNRKYALKIINKEFCKGKEELIDNEVRILRCVNHANIIRLVEDYSNQHQIFYIMELVKGGDLYDAISASGKYTEQDSSDMLYNLVSALQYLHALSIVHRDVKPENILIKQHEDGTKSLKLGDFGLAAEVRGHLYAVCGTPTYVAPEVIAETGYGLKIDVWSAGVIAYILLCGFPPFSSEHEDQEELFDLIMTGNYEFPSPYWDDISAPAKNVIAAMLEVDPDLRLTATQVLEHRWIALDTVCAGDGSRGTNTFRRHWQPGNHAGVKTTALDKASKVLRGQTAQPAHRRGRDV
ncbi:hypothetical protein BsWGS_17501 [Bradybaena similaris]